MKYWTVILAISWHAAFAQAVPIGQESAAAQENAGAQESAGQDSPDRAKDPPSDDQKLVPAEPKAKPRGLRFEMKTHPSVRVGSWLRVDFSVRFQQDFRLFDPEFSGDEGELANLRKFRVGVSGYVTRNFEYTVEREIRN